MMEMGSFCRNALPLSGTLLASGSVLLAPLLHTLQRVDRAVQLVAVTRFIAEYAVHGLVTGKRTDIPEPLPRTHMFFRQILPQRLEFLAQLLQPFEDEPVKELLLNGI